MAENDTPKKLKMSTKKFSIIWGSVDAFLLILIIVATVLMNFFSLSMDIFLGRGNGHTVQPENVDSWDTNYYDQKYVDSTAAIAETQKTALKIAEEGEVLLKNSNATLPLAKKAKVTPFGYRYLNPLYGGTGSGNVNTKLDYVDTPNEMLHEYFDVNETMQSALSGAKARGMTSNGYDSPNESGGFTGAGAKIIEVNASEVYTNELATSCANTTGLVFIGRVGGEGSDVQADVEGSAIYGHGYVDGTKHQLALCEDEKATLRYAKANCSKVVVILATSNVMEVKDLMSGDIAPDAILWIGGPGAKGYRAMAEILDGEVNPSGKTVDTWMTDIMADPSMNNFGSYYYSNLKLRRGGFPTPVGVASYMNTLEYEEGIYVGYRWYETVDDLGGNFDVFGSSGKSYADAVVFPFGYGLNYGTNFAQSIASMTSLGDTIELKVKVTNNGTTAGKDVVQVYNRPTYTSFDAANKIEKSTVNLVDFAKTDLLAAGASQEISFSIPKEDLAVYSYTHANADGTKGAYLLENGEYSISINKDAHDEYAHQTFNQSASVWYDSANPRQSEKDAQSLLNDDGTATGIPAKSESDTTAKFLAAHNLFDSMTDHMGKTDMLSRSSGKLANTTTKPTAADKIAPDGTGTIENSTDDFMMMEQMDLSKDSYLGNVEGSKVYTTKKPTTKAANGLSLSSFRGLDYYDPKWNDLLDQLDMDAEDLAVSLAASYDQTEAIAAVGKPASKDYDGPQGISGMITENAARGAAYPSEPIIAATYNKALALEMGNAVGQEALAAGVNGWYAPAMDIHRSPFSGRNFEYYSEDPVLSGKMGAEVVSGTSAQGLVTTIKHFALNDEECYNNDRSRVTVWADEQTMREIYLKPFEIAVKSARCSEKYISDNQGTVKTKVVRAATGIMNCMNYFGFTWGGASYELNTSLLRDEWGFQGMIISDMVMNAGSNSVDQCLRSGTDTWMAWGKAFTTLIQDKESATGITTIRRAVKNMCFAYANANAMNKVAPGASFVYDMAGWKVGLIVANCIVYPVIAGIAVWGVLRYRDDKKHPEKYKHAAKKAN